MIAASHLARCLSDADARLWIAWHEAVRDIRGNPYGVEIRRFGSATALLIHGIPLSYYNRVIGLGASDVAVLKEIQRFYRERLTPFRVDLNPLDSSPELLDELHASGLRPAEFQSNLYRTSDDTRSGTRSGVKIRRVKRHEARFFAQLYDAAYHGTERAPTGLAEFRAQSVIARYGRPGWRFYLAFIDGIPAAGGILFVDGGVGSLAGGATVATLRGRGCQKALLSRRIADAASLGCDLIVSRCVAGSISQRNLEQVGLHTAYTKVVWESRWLSQRPNIHVRLADERLPMREGALLAG